jgi:hypothetical protein
MAGNVSKICSDGYNPDFYRKSAPKVARGGSWKDYLCDLRVSLKRSIDLQ